MFSCAFYTSIHVPASSRHMKLLKELNARPGSDWVAPDQYAVECVALAYSNLNVACEMGVRYPSLIAMMNCQETSW